MTLADTLHAAYRRDGRTQAEIAHAMGLRNKMTLVKWIAGQRLPQPKYHARIAATLKIPPKTLRKKYLETIAKGLDFYP